MKRKAFTLIELVVVVLIIGILAAVAAPKMFDTAKEARENGTKQSLAVIRDALELYKARSSNGQYPALASLKTDLAPYIKGEFPKVQISNPASNAIEAAATAPPYAATVGTAGGWMYHAASGSFHVNVTGSLDW